MAGSVVDRFIDALHTLEQTGDVEPIVALFADDCLVRNVVLTDGLHGREGARRFWHHYRETFGNLRSDFRNVVSTGGRAALEWNSVGSSRDGSPIEYEGVSILEIEGDAIVRFTAYFDPRRVGRALDPIATL